MSQVKIYYKQTGGAIVPLTVSIDWLHDGAIKPRVFWTPDGTCYQVLDIYECVPLAFLKSGGDGLRFKVLSKIIETSDTDMEINSSLYEMYIYFEDNRFCEKNIVDDRYGHAGKVFIQVTMDIFPDGDYELTYFHFRDKRYKVEKICEIKPRASFHAGGLGLRHKITARRVNETDDEDPDPVNPEVRPAALYYEINKWFVSVNAS